MNRFEKFKKELPGKEKFYSSLTNRKITDKECEYVLNVQKKSEMKPMKDYYNLYFMMFYYQLMCLRNLEIMAQRIMDCIQVII